ncbi:D-alanine--D-alanine ligase [Planctomycetales bacterium]|nr:D-alanine--D-alanine ligase [Planctomycetales bacterium]GHS99659.1 D-alanine--D-alanine ligase [Planctomycetales bacterium]GHT06641.1 D-alanine--D-alanine ligase [Planctomycetales bacterium]GHV23013.1 D-alanine--D-alanine ligase [Planctomycetales bacterium]
MTNHLTSLKIAVLCGGVGAERDISLISGDAVFQALASSGSDIVKIDLTDRRLPPQLGAVDLAFLTLHGEFGEDGEAQKLLDQAGIFYTGSGADASALALDKFAAKERLRAAGVPVADGFLARRGADLATIARQMRDLALPVVVKPNARGSSVGVTMVRDGDELAAALAKAWQFDDAALVEKFIGGVEIAAGLLDGEPLPLVEIVPASGFYDYQAKYFAETEYRCPARLSATQTARAQTYAAQTWHALGLRDFARIDLICDNHGATVLEANTLPGFTPHSLLPKAAAVAGLDFPALCWRIVEIARRRQSGVESLELKVES